MQVFKFSYHDLFFYVLVKCSSFKRKKERKEILPKSYLIFSSTSHKVKKHVEVLLSVLKQLEKDGKFSKHQSSRLMLELCLGFPLWTSHFRESAVPRAIISLNSHMNILDAATRTDPSMDDIKK